MKLKIRVRGKGKSAELLIAPYSPAKKRCIDKIIGRINLERKIFSPPLRIDPAIEITLTSEQLSTYKAWLDAYNEKMKAAEEMFAADRLIFILTHMVAGLKKYPVTHSERAELIYGLLDDIKKELKASGFPAPKKQQSAKKSAPKPVEATVK